MPNNGAKRGKRVFPDNTWLFDIEIRNPIPEKNTQPRFGYRYCRHWGDHAGMGIACLVAARPDLSEVLAFVTGEDLIPASCDVYHLSAFAEMLRTIELVVGFNSRFFDCKLLAAKGIYIPETRHLDFLHEIKKATKSAAPKGYKMELLSQRCGGPAKNGSGAEAPYLWQEGHREQVIDYCKNDIKMLAAIAKFYAENGATLPAPEIGSYVKLRDPETIAAQDWIV